jgi:DNA repair exonuclease SbcCD ATPase subunit
VEKNNELVKESPNIISGFFGKILSPATITVLVTALVGPVSVSWVNNKMKNKEMQVKVITKVLEYTDKTDLSSPESIKKIGLIAKMVHENKEIFGLSFSGVDSAFNQLFERSEKGSIKLLKDDISQHENTISELTSKKESAESSLSGLKNEIKDLETKRKKLGSKNKETADKLNKLIQEKKTETALFQEKLQLYEQQTSFVNEKLDKIKEEKKKLIEDNAQKARELANYMKTFKKRDLTEHELRTALSDITRKWEGSIKEVSRLQGEVKKLNDRMAKAKKQMLASSKRLNAKIKALSKKKGE